MVKLDVWRDKLPEDKAKYYNKTRMSIEFFAKKLGMNHQDIITDFRRNGFFYNKTERTVRRDLNFQERPRLKKKTLPD
ncbi:MAG: hypothetical protein FWH16_01990 [Oscillospiraceae bacterium]|nr:hypothetical protein [Oscillospiraceae bacterium]